MNDNGVAVVPTKVAVGSEAVAMAKHVRTTTNREEGAKRQERILALKQQGYTYSEIGTIVGCNASTVGYYVMKAEGRLPASVKAKAAGSGIAKLLSKPPKKAPMVVSDFQREELLEGLADSLWSRLSVGDKVRIIQHVKEEDGQ